MLILPNFILLQYGRFIDLQSNLRKKKLRKNQALRTNQGPNILEAVLAIEIMEKPPIQFRRKS